MKEVIRFAKMLADPSYIRLLNLLRTGELCTCELESGFAMKREMVRDRLEKLRLSEIIRVRRRERWRAFEINPKYAELVLDVFKTFEDDLAFNEILLQDERGLRIARETKTIELVLRGYWRCLKQRSGDHR